MKVLMLSTDEKILQEGMEANLRMREYAGLFEQLHVVVIGKSQILPRRQAGANRKSLNEGNLFIYNVGSSARLSALLLAYKTAKKILNDSRLALGAWRITTQDPFELGLVGYLLKKKFAWPLQLQAHVDFLSPYFWHESLKNKIRVMMAKWLLPKADGIRVVSERIRRALLAANRQAQIANRINVLPIFVDVEKIKNAPIKTDLHKKYPQFDFIILMASRLSHEKNIGMAIEAMAEIVKRHPKAGLVIVGEGPEEKNQKSKVKSQNLGDNIKIEPWTDDLISYYKTADLFLLTSLYEGYGRTVIEAMAAGLPVIMTDVGIAGDLVKDGLNGYVVDVGDKRGLAERVVKLIESPSLRKEFSDNNLETVKSLPSKEIYLQKYKAVLEEIHA